MHTVVQATPSNDLSSEMFVFKVLEDMMSRGMYGLAELVVEYVGTGKKEVTEDYSGWDSSDSDGDS